MRFVHEVLPQRVVFAPRDAAKAVSDEVRAIGGRRVMLVASGREASLAGPIADALPVVLHHDDVVMHVPIEVAARARLAAVAAKADIIVSVGGGSSTGLAKAVALTSGLPIVAVPTTYAGSEATNVWGLTDQGTKTTGVDARVLPRSIVYDASLLAGLPRDLAVASGLNAMAHCIDAMWGPRADPIDQALAGEGIRALVHGLAEVSTEPAGMQGIEQTLYGAYLAATAFASAGSGLHHKICHVLGGMFDLPHAQTHAVVLPHVLAFNAANAPESEHRIAKAFGTIDARKGLDALITRLDAPRALRDLGMPEEGIEAAVPAILRSAPGNNPTPVDENNITALVRAAWKGTDPT